MLDIVFGEVRTLQGPYGNETVREFVMADVAGSISVANGSCLVFVGNETHQYSRIVAGSHKEALDIVLDDQLAVSAIRTFRGLT